MKHSVSRQLYAYWNRRRGNRPAPDRTAIEPYDLGPMLVDTFLLDLRSMNRTNIRFCGSTIAMRYGRDLADEDFLALWSDEDRQSLAHHLSLMAEDAVAMAAGVVAETAGGGFMTLAMIATYPDRWAAASAWVPLSDLRSWYDFHAGDSYGDMTRRCVGGDPGDDPSIAAEMDRRSPLHRLAAANNIPVDIAAGSYDGHNGAPIPIWHSLAAFNVIAEALGGELVSADEILQLGRHEPRLNNPKDSDMLEDPTFGRRILLRRYAHKSRVTIFEGGHEGLPDAALAWFDAH